MFFNYYKSLPTISDVKCIDYSIETSRISSHFFFLPHILLLNLPVMQSSKRAWRFESGIQTSLLTFRYVDLHTNQKPQLINYLILLLETASMHLAHAQQPAATADDQR